MPLLLPGRTATPACLAPEFGVATVSRHAAVRESYEKTRYNNLPNLLLVVKQKKTANGVLDKSTIQAALGKCQLRQQMWGLREGYPRSNDCSTSGAAAGDARSSQRAARG